MGELELVRRFVEECHSAAAAALLAGSRSRGEGRENSDYDVVLLFAEVPAAWRAMEGFEGAALECFAHDLGTLRYFLDEVERPSGKPVLARMFVEGLAVVGGGGRIAGRGSGDGCGNACGGASSLVGGDG